MKKSLKKALCVLMAGLMLAVTVPAVLPETALVTEVQAASKLAAPKLVSAKPSGKNKVIVKWKAVKGASGYRIYRKAKGGTWEALGNVKSAQKVVYTDAKATTGVQYTYTVKAFKKAKGKVSWSGYSKKGVTTVAGLSTLKLNSSKTTLYTGKTCTLRINGTKAVPAWKSSNTKVATVTKSGKVTAKSAGTARITATLYGRKLTCTVTVKKPSAAQSKLAQNYTKVKNYINKYGKVDEAGDRYIQMKVDSDITSMIYYSPKEDILDFGIILEIPEENMMCAMDIIANCVKSDKAKVYCTFFVDDTALDTEASMSARSYTGKNKITFRYENGKAVESEIQNAANATLQAAMEGANKLLNSKLKMSVKDIGFTSYR